MSAALTATTITFDYTRWGGQAEALKPLVGRRGTLVVHKVMVSGADIEDHVLLAGLTDEGTTLDQDQIRRLLTLPASAQTTGNVTLPDSLMGIIESQKADIIHGVSERQSVWFDEEMGKLDKWADDKRSTLKVNLRDLDDELKDIKKSIRQAANLPDKIALQRKAKQLEQKRDEAWREYDDGAREIERMKEDLIDRVEARLTQEVEEERIFAIAWELA